VYEPDESDELILRVQAGELTPDEAEAEAKRRGLKPLRDNPDPNDFDPMSEPHWTLPMAVAWIAYRTPEAVREQWDKYRTECWDWVYLSPRPGTGASVYSGRALETRKRATLDDLRFAAVLDDDPGEDGSPVMFVRDAVRALKGALENDKLAATGVNDSTDQRESIPSVLWQDLEFAADSKRDIVRTRIEEGRGYTRYDHVTVPRDIMRQLWAPYSATGRFELPPLMKPDRAGYMPLYCAAQWIATEGGTIDFDPENIENWKPAFAALIDHIASGEVAITGEPGERDSVRERIDGQVFANCPIDYPFQLSPDFDLSEEFYLRSSDYVDDKHWRGGFDDRFENRSEVLWKRLLVQKADVSRIWPFDIQAAQLPLEKTRGKPGAKPRYDWDAARAHIMERFHENGALMVGDPDWSCQADVERAIKQFFFDEFRQEPATSTVREKAREFINEFMAGNGR
jgi:hypothetical protein